MRSLGRSFTECFDNHPPRRRPMELPPCIKKPFTDSTLVLNRFLAFRVQPVWIQLCYFMSLSLVGLLLLKAIPPKGTGPAGYMPTDLDVFFMSTSAVTVSSMSVVEMEFFSNAQLVVLTILMLMGGEVFTSMLGLQLTRLDESETSGKLVEQDINVSYSNQIELGLMVAPDSPRNRRSDIDGHYKLRSTPIATDQEYPKSSAVRCLGVVVLGYILVVNLMGSSLVLVYLGSVSTARDVVRRKNISLLTFAVFSVISSFANCGFIPTNENMIVFRRHPGLLLLISAVILAGNTLYAPLLRSAIWALRRTTRRPELEHILENHREMGYHHLLPAWHCAFLALTVVGFLLAQFLVFCCMEWRSEGLKGMSAYQKLVGALFMSVTSRHAGESIVDISTISSAVLVLYVVMMYLPPYTTFMPVEHDHEPNSGTDQEEDKTRTNRLTMGTLIFSQLSYLAISTILICITERKNLSQDPLNFSVLNIVVEVVSAYGNAGFSTGYSCARRLKLEGDCKDVWTGFSGRWSNGGKLILICLMFFGRLKRFSMKGGKAWILA